VQNSETSHSQSLQRNLRHIWGDMMHYRPPSDIFFLGGGVSILSPAGFTPLGHHNRSSLSQLQRTSNVQCACDAVLHVNSVACDCTVCQSISHFHLIDLRLRNDLYCVEWGVKLYSLTPSMICTGAEIHKYAEYVVIIVSLEVVFCVPTRRLNVRSNQDVFTQVKRSL